MNGNKHNSDNMHKHPVEAKDSWETYLQRHGGQHLQKDGHRSLTSHHHQVEDILKLEQKQEHEFWEIQERKDEHARKKKHKKEKKHKRENEKLFSHPGIAEKTVHGLMIDAGSSGSRMHLFEWNPRILRNADDVEAAVSGRKLSYPGTDSRWTDRLSPGISDFADLPDEELPDALAKYLSPLMDFAKEVLRAKSDSFGSFPIYLRATAGMRTLKKEDRSRVMLAVRNLLGNSTYSPFHFEEEQARVISGEEEAIFGWTGVNFLLGNLIEDSQGAGTVVNPRLTYGALDLGGASTQISFFQPEQDIMSNLFKLQIGQGKHWNLYAHSYLYYGINEATDRFQAWLMHDTDANERLVDGIHNPCLPGGSKKDVRSNIYFTPKGVETRVYPEGTVTLNGYQNAVLHNKEATGDYPACRELVLKLLHKEKNTWCDFAHRGDCSISGVYQPEIPRQSEHVGEFLAFSNYYHVWDFLELPSRASLSELETATTKACSMSEKQLEDFAGSRVDAEILKDMCFRSTFALALLRDGYGFKMDDHITATNVVGGQKVDWALGAMMYEINTLPWEYELSAPEKIIMDVDSKVLPTTIFFTVLFMSLLFGLLSIFRHRRSRRQQYEPIKQADERC